jgi:aryl-alcohol dehydrogenase
MARRSTPISSASRACHHAIAHQRNVVVVPESAAAIPLERLAPLGCGLMTGAGAVLRSMKVRAGMPIAVFGTGTVGIAAIMAARIAGADPIFAVDINDDRLALARELGATHTVNARDDVAAAIRAVCPAGLGYALDTTGIARVIEGAFDCWRLGKLAMVGASGPEATLAFNETAFMGQGRTVMGVLGGDSDIGPFLRELIDLRRRPFSVRAPDRLFRFRRHRRGGPRQRDRQRGQAGAAHHARIAAAA